MKNGKIQNFKISILNFHEKFKIKKWKKQKLKN